MVLMAKQPFAGAFNGLFSEVRVQLAPLPELEAFYGSPTPVGGAFSDAKVIKSGETNSDSCKATFTHVVEISERKSSKTHIW